MEEPVDDMFIIEEAIICDYLASTSGGGEDGVDVDASVNA